MSYRTTSLADRDIEEIAVFVGADAPAAADRLIDRIYGIFETLSEHPEAGKTRDHDIGRGLRSFPLSNFVIFYRIAPNRDVEILRVLRAERSAGRLFESGEGDD